ncbi:MAG: hypothetical protein SF182_11755 [Deltaproteobacteria bacterium]|nr:hypothetical protein [Deltaproteobacteria bacterium]
MSLRRTLAAALALLTLSSVAPVGAVVLCISSDGCASLEPVAGWSGRCLESQCDDEHRGSAAEDHSCRDTPVLQHSLPSAPAAAAVVPPAQQPIVLAAPELYAPPIGAVAAHIAAARPPGAALVLRSIVLQL